MYRCQEINGHPFSASVGSIVLDANNPNSVTYVFVTVLTDASISSLSAQYNINMAAASCTKLSSTQWRCPGNGVLLYTSSCSTCMTFIRLHWVHDAAPVLARFSSPYYGADKAQLAAPQECDSIRSALQGVQVIGQGGYTGPDQMLLGSSANDSLTATPGSDCILGGGGNDTLRGEAGNDILIGGPGDDQIDGGPGYDICYGGPGVDTFSNCEVIVQD
jgi:Ca2+-binding RTX toxin-like protein